MEPLLHFAIPFTLAAILGLTLRWAFLAGFIAVLPDMDVLFYAHRSISHTLVIPIILLIASLPLQNRPKLRFPLQLTGLSLASHVILDFFHGYTPVLWPISNVAYTLVFDLQLHMGNNPPMSLNFNLLQEPYKYGGFTTLDAVFFTAEGFIIATVLIAIALLWKRRTGETTHP